MAKERLDVHRILREMTLEEKAAFVNGATFFGMAAIPRLGIPRLQLLDGGTGINFEQLFGDYYSQMGTGSNSTNGMMGSTTLANVIENYYHPENLTKEERKEYSWIQGQLTQQVGSDYAPGCYPPGILLGATFCKSVVHAVGQALGAEARLFGVHILLGTPNVNIHRDPLNGRLFEGYSEDPCLIASLAPELVKGVQEFGVAANVKHFAANNQETNRVGINEVISERAMKEIYLPGFAACVKEGHVQTVMSAYNRINQIPCTENYQLLTQELRDNWGFEGSVISDWGAVYHPVQAILAGNDLAMPGPIEGAPLVNAVRRKELPEQVLDQAVERLLKLVDSCMKEPLEGKTTICIGTQEISCSSDEEGRISFQMEQLYTATTKAAYDAAVEGIVLIKNEKQTFPLSKEQTGRIVLMGSAAQQLLECGEGSAGITTNRTCNLAEQLSKELSEERVQVLSQEKVGMDYQTYLKQKRVTHIIYMAKVGGMEGNDRPNLKLSEEDEQVLLQLGRIRQEQEFRLSLVLNVCGPVDTSSYEAFTDAIWVCFLPGMEGAHALADLMLGKKTPSGKLPLTFPKRYEDTPAFLNFPGDGYEVHYGEGIYVGYRYYDKKRIEPAYAFGFGLSYTEFKITEFSMKEKIVTEELHISMRIQNTGHMPGAEVVQIYISDWESALSKPVKELKAFDKIFLLPGESRKITFTLKQQQFASYASDYHQWIAEEGYYDIIVATSAREEDIVARKPIYLENETPYSYGIGSTVKVMYEQETLRGALEDLWQTKSWDWQIVKSNYQYTPNRKLIDIFPEKCKEGDDAICAFLEKVKQVKKR